MADSPDGFDLLGDAEDETRLLLHRGCGYSIPIPGHPVFRRDVPAGPPTFDVTVELRDLPIEIGFRVDDVPTGIAGEPLALSLVQAYAVTRAIDTPRGGPLRGGVLAAGADGGAGTTFRLPDRDGKQQMEHLTVSTRSHPDGMWAIYQSTRDSNQEVNPVKWAHVRTAIYGNQHWDPAAPRTAAPRLWPEESAFAALGVTLTFVPSAWEEAQDKAADIGPLTDEQVLATLDVLMNFSNNDNPPTFELHPYVLDMACQQVAMRCPTRAAEALLRNISLVKTMHDFRAWIWQCIWGVGNRHDRGQDQR